MELSTRYTFIAILKFNIFESFIKLTIPFSCNKNFYYVLSTCTVSSQLVSEISGPDSPIRVGSISSASNAIVVILSAPHIPDA